jgi:catechol 2,3-dioxygenase-like lactoylglutathione lyase family enzyme
MIPIQIQRLDHVQLCIPIGAEDEARRFYAGVLGLTEIEKPEALKPNGGLWFEAGDIQLHLGTEPAVAASKRHPAFEVTDVDAAREWLVRQGVRVQEEIVIPGCERFSFFDPFGNRIEFLEKKLS